MTPARPPLAAGHRARGAVSSAAATSRSFNHSRTVSGSVVDGHSAHGADNLRAANSDSSAARRRRYGQSVVFVPDNRSRSKTEAREFVESRT
ncbi:hypothetical protein [Streptomyces coeruleorubidus]|uniref:hypothetical protein n=1 Tax=Streptomyces coeruleorubidus TaxID=116188 RepID=UPI0036C6E30F